MHFFKYGFIFLLSLVILSCGKDQARLEKNLIETYDGKTTNLECNGLDLNKNLLKKDKVLNIFGCIGWKQEFPLIFNYIKSLDQEDFDLLFSPLNDELFKTSEKRNSFLAFIQEKISKKEISSISKEAREILENTLLIKSLASIVQDVSFLLPSKEVIDDTLNLLSEVSKKSLSKRLSIKKSITNISADDISKLKFDSMKLSVAKKVLNLDSNFLIYTRDFLNSHDWSNNFLKTYTASNIYSLVTYPFEHENITTDLDLISSVIKVNINNCSEFNSIYELDYQIELNERLQTLAATNKVSFLMDVFELSQRFSLFNNICPYDEFNKTSSRVLGHMRNYILMPGGYEFLKVLATISNTNTNPYLIFDMVKSDSFDLFGQVMKQDAKNATGLLENTYSLLQEFNLENFHLISDLLIKIEQEKKKGFFVPLTKLSEPELLNLLNMGLEDVLLNKNLDINTTFLSKTLKKYPHIYESYKSSFNDNKLNLAFLFHGFKKQIDNSFFRKELIKFLNDDVFFKLISMLSRDKVEHENTSAETKPFLIERKVEKPNTIEEEQLLVCLGEFDEIASADYDFWHLLEHYPKSCIELTTQKSLASHIFQWTLQIDNIFTNEVDDRFSYRYGMISPKMMSFYHSLMHIINTHLNHPDEYVANVVGNIRKELFDKGLVNVLNSSVSVLKELVDKTDSIDKLLLDITKLENDEFNNGLITLLRPLAQDSTLATIPEYNCSSVNSEIGGDTCFNKQTLENFIKSASKLLSRDNGAEKKLYELLIDFALAPKGIKIPFDARKQRTKKLDIEELVRFLFDMTNPMTKKEILFSTKDSTKTFLANRAERLEVVIREISFLNNFYGAFFMNTVARAKKYYKKVKSMKKNVSVMNRSSNFFRNRGLFPEETKWAFRNILQTYSSLYELELAHIQPDGGQRRYGDLIQAILTMAVESSSLESQKYSPLQSPKPSLVKQHNGMFITGITDLGLLNQLGTWLRKISSNDLMSIINNKDFKSVAYKFKNLLSPKKAKELISIILTSKNKDLLIRDFVNFIYNKEHRESEVLLNTVWKSLSVVSKGILQYDVDQLVPLVKVLLDNYDVIREQNFVQMNFKLLKELALFLDKVNVLGEKDIKKLVSIVLNLVKSIDPDELENLIKSKEFFDRLSSLKENFALYAATPSYNTGFLSAFLNDKQLDFSPILQMLKNVHNEQGDFQYIKNIITVLSIKDENATNLDKALKEIFDKNDDVVIKFLTDMFNKFYRPSIQ